MPAFSLNDWIVWWKISEFGFTVLESDSDSGASYAVPLSDKLDEVIQEYRQSADKKDREKIEKILGKSYGIIQGGSMSYHKLMVLKTFHHISEAAWDALDLEEKAKYIAHIQVENEISTYQRILEEFL